MEKDNVPQDNENLLEGKPMLKYAVDKDGKYVKAPSLGWEPENIVLQQAWEEINHKVIEAKEQVLAGKLSPLAYHIEKNMMDVSLVADYMGFSKRKVRAHLTPYEFNGLKQETLLAYADVFKITVDALLKVE